MIRYDHREKERLRALALQWAEAAASGGMKQRKNQWKALKDLKPERPMIHFETCSVNGYIAEGGLQCRNQALRNVEQIMLLNLKQYHEVGDDLILEPYLQLAWKVDRSDFGVDISMVHAENSMGYVYKSAFQGPEDIEKLKPRSFSNDTEPVLELKEALEAIFGDILPVHVGNVEILTPDQIGYNPLVGTNTISISCDMLRLLGQENMMIWAYDYPDAIKSLAAYLRDDRFRFYDWMEKEGLLDYNANGWNTSASSYGYCSDLPDSGKLPAKLKNCWVWAESQETLVVSPDMFAEFYLPYIAEVAGEFGLAYYGCCEPIQDRIHLIKKAIPNLRAVSISTWNDMYKAAEAVGKGYVFSRKPNPSFLSGPNPQWDPARKDIEDTVAAAKDMPLEFIIRDVYDVSGDYERIGRYVRMIREICGI